jgi:SAM-dependent methyltransferase
MDDLDLLLDLHLPNARQGPGTDAATRRALDLAGLRGRAGLTIADLGCGTGASTLVLAEDLDARITAVDFLPAFLDALRERAAARGVADRITTLAASIDALPFAPGSLDAIWSEGAIYNLGFEAGLAAWRPFLKPGGVLAVSELTWLTAERPAELQAHWEVAYPQVATASAKLGVLEAHGFSPIGYFPLPREAWMDAYYTPLRARFPAFLQAHPGDDGARAIVEAEELEIGLYDRFSAFVSYGFYVARRVGG